MKGYVIDPFAKTVTLEDIEGPEEIADVIGQETVVRYEDGPEIYVDGNALTREPQAFWRWRGGDTNPICGRSVLFPPQDQILPVERVLAQIEWPNIRFMGLRQHNLGWSDTEYGRGQMILVVPEYEDLDEVKPPILEIMLPKMRFWTVTQEPDRYVATLSESGGAGIKQLMELDHPTLEGLHNLLPHGLARIPRADNDDATIVETWLEKD